jgi:hypothetical protein
MRNERPSCCTPNQRDELSPSHELRAGAEGHTLAYH